MKKFIIFILVLCLAGSSSFAQLKYNSSGDLGIGTAFPAADFHFVGSNANVFFENSGTSSMYFRVRSNSNSYHGPYFRVYDTSGNLYMGMNNNSTSASTSYDKNILKISNSDGRIEYWPQSSVAGAITMITYAKASTTKCYVVDYGPQNFYVYGNGHVYHTGITDLSDESIKTNIADVSSTIENIKKLRPVSYNLKTDSTLREVSEDLDFGLVAQEVEKIFPDVVDERDDGLKGICYNEVTALLIKAMQEQQDEIETLKEQIEALSGSKSKSVALTSNNPTIELNSELFQNVPNPFNVVTRIRYNLPQIESYAMINVYDLQGKQLERYDISTTGIGEIEIPAFTLSPGVYIYKLILDNEIIDTKQMLLID